MSLRTENGVHPWEVSHARRSLRVRLVAYVRAMERARRWDGGSLTRRRAELRTLADRCGQREDLEQLLPVLERTHAEHWATVDEGQSGSELGVPSS